MSEWVADSDRSAAPAERSSSPVSDWVPDTVVAGKNAPAPQSWAEYLTSGITGGINTAGFGLPNRLVAAKRALTGEAPPSYDAALEQLNAQQKRFKDENPWTNVPIETAAGLAGGLGGGAILRKALPVLESGVTLGQRALLGATEGATLGAAQGAGTTYSGIPSDYVKHGGMGMIFGAGLGAAAPVAGTVAGKAYRAAADRGWGGGPQGTLVDAAHADRVGVNALASTPEAMLPDAGPSMRGVAQGARVGTGPGRTALVDNLKARDDNTARRIVGSVDQEFGPAPTPSYVEAGVRENMERLGPAYEAALANAHAINPDPMALWLEGQIGNTRGPAQAALREVRSMLDVPTNPGTLDPHPRAMQSARSAVRGMASSATDPHVRGVLEQVERQMTRELQDKVPGIRAIDAHYAELGSQERAIQPSSPGGRIFKTDQESVIRPTELADTMAETAQAKGIHVGPSAEPFRLRQAARAELDRIVGTNKNDLVKLENILAEPHDWNPQKLAIMFGEDRARQLRDVIQRERNFRQSYQDVVQGSQTAQRTAAAKQLDEGEGKIPLNITLSGMATRGAQGIWDAMRKEGSNATRDRIAGIMATRDPVEIQQLASQMLQTRRERDMRQEITRRLVERATKAETTAAASNR